MQARILNKRGGGTLFQLGKGSQVVFVGVTVLVKSSIELKSLSCRLCGNAFRKAMH